MSEPGMPSQHRRNLRDAAPGFEHDRFVERLVFKPIVSTEFPLFRPERDRQKSEVFGAPRSAVRMAMLAKPAVDTRIAVHSCTLQLRCPPTTRARGGR